MPWPTPARTRCPTRRLLRLRLRRDLLQNCALGPSLRVFRHRLSNLLRTNAVYCTMAEKREGLSLRDRRMKENKVGPSTL